MFTGIAALTGPSQAAPVSFTVILKGAQQVRPMETIGIRTGQFDLRPGEAADNVEPHL